MHRINLIAGMSDISDTTAIASNHSRHNSSSCQSFLLNEPHNQLRLVLMPHLAKQEVR
jgi:hypothetical protein